MKRVLVTGASGYIGSRLVLRLLDEGYLVRAGIRSYEKFKSRKWSSHPNIEFSYLDVMNLDSIKTSLENVDIAYYLIHSMNPSRKDFVASDRQAALNMVDACNSSQSLKHLIYLGGLGENTDDLSQHLKSRLEVASILKTVKIPFTELRAAMIIGSGSASFEILRYLVDRLPIMVTPKWVQTPCEPIAIRNVLYYLIKCIECEGTYNKSFDIGCGVILNYQELMEIYAQEANLPKRVIIPVPVFTPWLSSYWIHYVTPVPASIARPLAQGLRNPVICKNIEIRNLIPQELLSPREAIKLALDKMQHHEVESHWTDAGLFRPCEWWSPDDPSWSGGTVYYDIREARVKSSAEELWQPLVRIGGQTGYYYGNWLWVLRGILDKMFGGVGLRRGRRHPSQIEVGDALDFWRVAKIVKDKQLLLNAEMKLPGLAVLEFDIVDNNDNTCTIRQIARFHPSGLFGILYWYLVLPFHEFVFSGMLKGIIKACGKKTISFKKIK